MICVTPGPFQLVKTTVAQVLRAKDAEGESPGWSCLGCGAVCLIEDESIHSYFLRLYCVKVRGTAELIRDTPPTHIHQQTTSLSEVTAFFNLQFPFSTIGKCILMGVPISTLISVHNLFPIFLSFHPSLILSTACKVTVGAGAVHPIQIHCNSKVLPQFPCRCKCPCLCATCLSQFFSWFKVDLLCLHRTIR